FVDAVERIGLPCLVKPIMSSSGKGQSFVRNRDQLAQAWSYAQEGGRAGKGKVIVEGFVDFDFEITLLTIRHRGSDGAVQTSFCAPIGHRQENGDYQESWQPQVMTEQALERAKDIAEKVTTELGGLGLFGVELFVKGEQVIFSEVSPRPHDTGLVTLISQDLSEFALHARAILGLPIPNIHLHGPSASAVLLVAGESQQMQYSGLDRALAAVDTQLRLFGKPEVKGQRRLGVALARGATVDEAKAKSLAVIDPIQVSL
ncbi:MAG: formate-dependent phosphoribosylglycinamide formyltransferase, partial [Pseudomonadota bacterium]